MALTPEQKRTPRYKRVGAAHLPLHLRSRDHRIIQLVYDYRLITSNHIQLLTGGSAQNVLRRLQKFFHHGYLDRLKLSNNDPILYGLGNRGADLLAELGILERGKIDWTSKNRELKERYLAHTLMVSRFRATLALALRDAPETKIISWVPEGELREDVVITDEGRYQKRTAPLVPDGFFALEDHGDEVYFFLEADQSTMSDQRFLRKMKAYWMHWKLGKHKEKQGIESFRVLTITKSAARRDNLRGITRQADDRKTGSEMFWFATERDYTEAEPASILRPIWLTARQGDEMHSLLE